MEPEKMMDSQQAPPDRKVGAARFFELMGRDLWSFYKASFLCLLGFVPALGMVAFGVMAASPLICVAGGTLGGLIGAPFLCGMFDTVFRALRDEPGYWWHTYRMAWRQNWRDALAPGAIFGLWAGLWIWLISATAGREQVPMSVWICLVVGAFIGVGFFCYVFAQIVLVSLPLKRIMKNAGLFYLGLLPRTLSAAAVNCLYWGLILLYLPYSLPVTLVTGFWLPSVIALQILYPGLEKAFHLESTINARRSAELEHAMGEDASHSQQP